MHMRQREFDEFHFMCTALLLPNCRDAFLRLSQLPSLRDWRFYSAILLAEIAIGDFIRQSCLLRSKNASLQLFVELNVKAGTQHPLLNVSSTNSTLCAQSCYCQTVETHSCVSASCQVFATGDFIRQSCLLRRKNASLQLFVELNVKAGTQHPLLRVFS